MTTVSGQTASDMDDQDWQESVGDILKTVGRQVKLWRERAGLTQAELGQRIGCSEELVSSVERGRRAPEPGFLDSADETLDAGGILAAFMARQSIFNRWPAPILSFVQEEVTLGRLRNVEIQVMPTDREDHAGMGGEFILLGPKNGPAMGHISVQNFDRTVTDRNEVRTLEARYGIIRAQALTPRESLAFIEKVLGET